MDINFAYDEDWVPVVKIEEGTLSVQEGKLCKFTYVSRYFITVIKNCYESFGWMNLKKIEFIGP